MVCLHYTRQGGTLSRLIFRDLSRALYYRLAVTYGAAGTRMPWHPVPRRAASAYLQYRLLSTCSRLISYAVYKESALFLGISFWLHQRRIPRHTCRFYCCLAAHQRTKEMDSAEPLSSMEPRLRGSLDSTSSPRGYPLRRGITAAAVDRDIGFRYPVQTVYRHFDVTFGYLCSG